MIDIHQVPVGEYANFPNTFRNNAQCEIEDVQSVHIDLVAGADISFFLFCFL